jgi:hypothetical protein
MIKVNFKSPKRLSKKAAKLLIDQATEAQNKVIEQKKINKRLDDNGLWINSL